MTFSNNFITLGNIFTKGGGINISRKVTLNNLTSPGGTVMTGSEMQSFSPLECLEF